MLNWDPGTNSDVLMFFKPARLFRFFPTSKPALLSLFCLLSVYLFVQMKKVYVCATPVRPIATSRRTLSTHIRVHVRADIAEADWSCKPEFGTYLLAGLA